jgi:hypothetical protein
MNSTESPATSLLALTNTLQPVVSRCLLGWPVKRSLFSEKIATSMLNHSICQQQLKSWQPHFTISIADGSSFMNATDACNQTLAFTGILSMFWTDKSTANKLKHCRRLGLVRHIRKEPRCGTLVLYWEVMHISTSRGPCAILGHLTPADSQTSEEIFLSIETWQLKLNPVLHYPSILKLKRFRCTIQINVFVFVVCMPLIVINSRIEWYFSLKLQGNSHTR